jgi:hypothetical protein
MLQHSFRTREPSRTRVATLVASVFLALCALSSAADQAFTVAGWGDNSLGQLGIPTSATDVAEIAAGEAHAVALRADGKLVTWGRNDVGQTTLPSPPAGNTEPVRFAAVACGPRHTMAFTNYGLISWGAVTAVPNTGGRPLRAIAAGGDFNLFLATDGFVAAAGSNGYGQTVVPQAATSGVIAIAAGSGHALALRIDGTVVAWGRNDYGQAAVPSGAKQVFAIAAGPDFSVALRLDGGVIVWGRGADTYLTPPLSATGASTVTAGTEFIAVQSDNGIVTWGNAAPSASSSDINRSTSIAAGSRFLLAVRAPYFTKLPGVVQARVGEPAELSAEVSHTADLTAYWGPKSTTPGSLTLKFPNVAVSQNGSYTVTIEYATGYTMSATGILLVPSPPRLTEYSSGIMAATENESIPLFVNVEGTGPFVFQWRKNGVPIALATSQFWTIQPVRPSDAGVYTCLVKNAAGEAETSGMEVQVLPAKTGREIRTTLVESGANIALRVVPNTAKPPFRDYVWTKNDVVIAGATGPELALTNFAASDEGSYWVSFIDGYGSRDRGSHFDLRLYTPSGPPYHLSISPVAEYVKPGSQVTLTLGGTSGYRNARYRWQIQQSGQPTLIRSEINLTSLTLNLTTAPDRVNVMVTMEDPPIGGIPAFSNIDVRDTEPALNQLIRVGGPAEMVSGETGTLEAVFAPAGGEMIWTKDGAVLPGQASSKLVIRDAKKSDAGIYRARPAASATTTPAYFEVKIIELPVIVKQPASASLANGPAHLVVELSLRAPSGYPTTWYRDGVEYWTDAGQTGTTSELVTSVAGVYRARVYLPSGIVETDAATVTAGTGSVAVGVPSGVYLDTRGAVYVRPDRTVVVAAAIDWKTVGWFGEATLDASGSFVIPRAMRVVADSELMALDDRLPFSGQISQEGELRAFCGPMPGQTIRTLLDRSLNRGREGFFKAKLPGTAGGEIWVFVTADNRASVYLHDGFAIYAFPTINPSNLKFSADGDSVSYGAFPFGPFIALRESASVSDGQLVNLSIRANAGRGDRTLIAGLVISGSKPRQVLLRAAGPALSDVGVAGALQDPVLRLFKDGQSIAENNDWGTDRAALSAAFSRLGAFAFKEGSKDAVLLATLSPGVYSAQVIVPAGLDPGEALFESYDDGGGDPAARLSNLSSRVAVAPGAAAIQGFVVTGTQPKRMLIRSVGPALREFGVADALPNPRLSIFRQSTLIMENDDWSADPESTARIATIAARVGAFPLPVGSRDSAVVGEFMPGVYSAQVRSSGEGESGVTLIEIYEVP